MHKSATLTKIKKKERPAPRAMQEVKEAIYTGPGRGAAYMDTDVAKNTKGHTKLTLAYSAT